MFRKIKELSKAMNAMRSVTQSVRAPLKRILRRRQAPRIISNGGKVIATIAMNGSVRIL
ncbi:MAG: hypothetical protein QF426_03600 [Verrucomicrobiales bacterium]|jgi:hypothetical protein|nr:hypothetical protein [Verrucomicrobiales bacterium]MEC7357051.1 hypothetical protein [Verrucomicrobiota bacterium]